MINITKEEKQELQEILEEYNRIVDKSMEFKEKCAESRQQLNKILNEDRSQLYILEQLMQSEKRVQEEAVVDINKKKIKKQNKYEEAPNQFEKEILIDEPNDDSVVVIEEKQQKQKKVVQFQQPLKTVSHQQMKQQKAIKNKHKDQQIN